LANTLDLKLNLYQDGILRVLINENSSERFKLTDIGIGVEED
jgi:hypothetical protein